MRDFLRVLNSYSHYIQKKPFKNPKETVQTPMGQVSRLNKKKVTWRRSSLFQLVHEHRWRSDAVKPGKTEKPGSSKASNNYLSKRGSSSKITILGDDVGNKARPGNFDKKPSNQSEKEL